MLQKAFLWLLRGRGPSEKGRLRRSVSKFGGVKIMSTILNVEMASQIYACLNLLCTFNLCSILYINCSLKKLLFNVIIGEMK